jgi:hypothetical protein
MVILFLLVNWVRNRDPLDLLKWRGFNEESLMTKLDQFVRDALLAGKTREEVRAVLQQAGWHPDEIDDALAQFADVDFPIPVPRRRYSGSARDALFYLVTFLALYVGAVSLGAILFGYIDMVFPDPAERGGYPSQREAMRWYLAGLIVSFPLYFVLTRKGLEAAKQDPQLRESPVRKWLTAITLFVAASIILFTVINLLAEMLGGELVVRFFLKALVVLIITGGVFGFYLWDLRRGETKK